MRVAGRIRAAALPRIWDHTPNHIYTDPVTNEDREVDYVLDWLDWNNVLTLGYTLCIECKDAANPWVVFKGSNEGQKESVTIFDCGTGVTVRRQQSHGQLSGVETALNRRLRQSMSPVSHPGYAIAEAFKAANSRDVAHNATRQALAAAVGTMSNVFDSDTDGPAMVMAVPIVVTTSPLFEARLAVDGESVLATSVDMTTVTARLGSTPEAQVVVVNETSFSEGLLAQFELLNRIASVFLEDLDPALIPAESGSFIVHNPWLRK
jgi:hypothetical protein